jgi:surfactin synthase thioesterase subunit
MNTIPVFCFPFAGGTEYSYQRFAKFAPPQLALKPVPLPGRGRRAPEPLRTDVHALVDDLLAQLKGELHKPYLFYGHSMGALLGFLLAKRIVAEALPPPLHLFVTGCGGPAAENREKDFYKLPRQAFIEAVRKMGGMPPEVLADAFLMDYLEPILRADFQVTGTYRYEPSPPLPIPITAVVGLKDEVSLADALLWQRETTVPLRVKQFPGDHFFIFDHEIAIIKLLYKSLSQNLISSHE